MCTCVGEGVCVRGVGEAQDGHVISSKPSGNLLTEKYECLFQIETTYRASQLERV